MDKKEAIKQLEELARETNVVKESIELLETTNKVLSDFWWHHFGYKFSDLSIRNKATQLSIINESFLKHIKLCEKAKECPKCQSMN